MKIRSFRITDDCHIKEVPAEEASPDWLQDPIFRWIDMEAPELEDLVALLEPMNIDAEALLAKVEAGSGFFGDVLDGAVFIRIPTLASASGTDLTHFAFLCLPTTLVTLHPVPIAPVPELATRLMGPVPLKSPSVSALVYQLVVRLCGENYFAFTACRQTHDTLAMQLIEDSDNVEPEDIFALRRHITNIADANEDHAFCVDVLQKFESTSFSAKEQLGHLQELDRTLSRHQRSMDRLEENVKDLHQQFLLAVQDRTGNRLKVLTILSAIFLPLTLLAGIYGMNFEYIPELSVRYGYFATLGLMAFVGVGMLVFFYVKGWFD